jgi:hypothetical protein
VLRSLQGAIIGLCFLVSAVIGRPIMFYIVRQAVTASARDNRARFEAAIAAGFGRVFTTATLVWGSGLIVASILHVALALVLRHDTFLLISPVIGIAIDVLLIGWSTRYIARQIALYRRNPG